MSGTVEGMTRPPQLPTPAAVLTVERLTKRYGRLTAVDDVSFAVRPGVVTGFLGPNGAGKTTMLAMLAGLVRPTSGRVLLGGTPLRERSPEARTIGVAIDSCGAHPGRSARQHLRILAGFARLPRTRVEEVLALSGLTEVAARRVGTFSLGMRQRLGLAAALLGDPEVLLLDEPANGLDPEGIRWLRTLLRERAEQGRAVLVSSHLLSEAAHTVDDIVVVRQGRVVHAGAIADLTPASGVWVRTDEPGRLAEAVVRAGGRVTPDVTGGRYLIDGLDAPTVAEATRRAQVDLHELTPRSTSLEDVFLELTGARS
ncbi:ABC transporter ATP-binding protein [Plantactinospora endophytica]|uniref:ABC transporter ATP-binding protein n=2 Tax=Plantactinospora endophytica TaxID=673535 RepID=A0ABQ4EDD5_9ACTN|nr:ABC transporter ATP-binding protein [Plantactinospora endophytica]